MGWRRILLLLIAGTSVASLGIVGCTTGERNFEAEAQTPVNSSPIQTPAPALPPQEREADVPFVPTPQSVVNAMLELAKVGPNDVLYDLGSGDGRIPITAVQKYGARRATGIEISPQLVQQSRNNAQTAGVRSRVEFRQQDLFNTDLSNATVVTLYLLPEVNLRLRPKLLQELKPGTRIVSHNYTMGDWKPERVVQMQSEGDREHTLYYWVVPEKVPENLRSGLTHDEARNRVSS